MESALTPHILEAAQAEEVLQTVYLSVLDGRARYEARSSFRTWIFGVIRRTAASERRRAWLRGLHEVDRILNMEREIKKAQISLMVRIKNTLTPEQQKKLADIRSRMG